MTAGFTQQNIADVLGMNRSTYTYYETGKTQPSITNIQRLAVLYGLTVEDILNENMEFAKLGKRSKKKVLEYPECISELSAQEKTLVALLRLCDRTKLQKLIKKCLSPN